MQRLQNFYRAANTNLSMEVAFCVCRGDLSRVEIGEKGQDLISDRRFSFGGRVDQLTRLWITNTKAKVGTCRDGAFLKILGLQSGF